MSKNVLKFLSDTLINENGMPNIGVCIWREDKSFEIYYKGTVGEFLSRKENQYGNWLIDGGWGGPPGPIKVIWNNYHWVNYGFPPWANDVNPKCCEME
jgi:hypothetical protein